MIIHHNYENREKIINRIKAFDLLRYKIEANLGKDKSVQ